jgi:hypothetical protein
VELVGAGLLADERRLPRAHLRPGRAGQPDGGTDAGTGGPYTVTVTGSGVDGGPRGPRTPLDSRVESAKSAGVFSDRGSPQCCVRCPMTSS